jgi:hypothetical protein
MSEEFPQSEIREAAPNPAERSPRLNVMLMATVEHFRWAAPTRHRVRDLSMGGARIDNAEKMLAGETLQISIGAAQAITATIKWVRQGFAGLSFEEVINVDEARKNVASQPKPIARPKLQVASSAPTAGWYTDLKDPYRD